MEDIRRGVYRHFKGGTISVIGVAHRSDGKNSDVIYIGNQDGKLYSRPFMEFVDYVEVDGKQVHRFELVEAKNINLQDVIDQAFSKKTPKSTHQL